MTRGGDSSCPVKRRAMTKRGTGRQTEEQGGLNEDSATKELTGMKKDGGGAGGGNLKRTKPLTWSSGGKCPGTNREGNAGVQPGKQRNGKSKNNKKEREETGEGSKKRKGGGPVSWRSTVEATAQWGTRGRGGQAQRKTQGWGCEKKSLGRDLKKETSKVTKKRA